MDASPLNAKTWIVTGAGRGIGRAIALRLGADRANVVVSARTAAEIARVADEVAAAGGQALPVVADVSDEAAVTRLVGAAAERFGTIDGLVNNAGIGTFTSVATMATADFDRMWGVNMRGVFLATRAVLPYMTRQASGDIVNIASLAGRNAFTGGAGYAATKWALIGFSRCLMLEVRDKNIRVITLCPGSVDTAFSGPSHHAGNAAAIPSADSIAAVALDALRMPRNTMVSEIDIRPTNPKG
jgi:3-oxoacyl-[acyl-carrier protein] reductase